MASVNAWRFKLAEEEEKRRRQLGFKDIMDLLMTGFQAYQGVQGIKQGRAAQELAQSKQDFNVQKETMGATEAGRIGTWDRAPDNYVGPAPANETAGPMGRMQFTQTGTALDEARRKEELDMLRGGWQSYDENAVGADIMPQHWQRGGGYVRNPLADAEAERGFLEANPPIYDPSQPFTLTNRGHVETPGFVSQGQRDLAGIRAAGSGGGISGPDIGRFRQWAKEEANGVANAQGWIDEFTGNIKPEAQANWDSVFNQKLQEYMGGAPPPEQGDDLSFGAVFIEMAQGYAAQNPEAMADFADADPMTQAVVALLAQNLPGLAAGQTTPGAPLNRGTDLGGLMELIAGEAAQSGELMAGKMSEIQDLDAEEDKWNAALSGLAAVPYSGARAQREQQIRVVLGEIAAERQRRLVEARTMGIQNRRPTPVGGMGGLGSLR